MPVTSCVSTLSDSPSRSSVNVPSVMLRRTSTGFSCLSVNVQTRPRDSTGGNGAKSASIVPALCVAPPCGATGAFPSSPALTAGARESAATAAESAAATKFATTAPKPSTTTATKFAAAAAKFTVARRPRRALFVWPSPTPALSSADPEGGLFCGLAVGGAFPVRPASPPPARSPFGPPRPPPRAPPRPPRPPPSASAGTG